MDSYNFPLNVFVYTNKIFTTCPEKVLITNKNNLDSDLTKQLKSYNQIYSQGYEKKEGFLQMINNTKNFDNLTYRAQIILITAMYIENSIRLKIQNVQS